MAVLSPTLDFHNAGGLRYGISFDNEEPQVINMHAPAPGQIWDRWVSENAIKRTSTHQIGKAGEHVLKFWMIDPGVVLQKLIVETGKPSQAYLGPPESVRIPIESMPESHPAKKKR